MEENSFDDFHARFTALVQEAKEYGLDAYVILNNEDPITGTAGITPICRSSPIKRLGMARYALLRVEAELLH